MTTKKKLTRQEMIESIVEREVECIFQCNNEDAFIYNTLMEDYKALSDEDVEEQFHDFCDDDSV